MTVTPPRWPICRHVQRHAELMDRMMRALDIDGAAAARQQGGRAFAEARTACLRCSSSDACEDWLAATDCSSTPPEFCSARGFFRLLIDEGRLARRA